jgi:hypothetical protein
MTIERILASFVKTNKQANKEITELVKANLKRNYLRIIKNYFIESILVSGVEKEILLSAYETVDFNKVLLQADIYKNLKIGDRVRMKKDTTTRLEKERYRSKVSPEFRS